MYVVISLQYHSDFHSYFTAEADVHSYILATGVKLALFLGVCLQCLVSSSKSILRPHLVNRNIGYIHAIDSA